MANLFEKALPFLTALAIFCSFFSVASAEEVVVSDLENTTENAQLIEVENAGGIVLFQKQPVYEKQLQIVRVKKSGGLLLIQINGKIKDTNNTEK